MIELYTRATTFGTGPFQPAIRTGRDIYTWAGEYENEEEAYAIACVYLRRAEDAAMAVAKTWKVTKA